MKDEEEEPLIRKEIEFGSPDQDEQAPVALQFGDNRSTCDPCSPEFSGLSHQDLEGMFS